MQTTIISVGKKHWPELKPALQIFEKRLQYYTHLQWLLIPDSGLGATGQATEAAAILHKLQTEDFVIALDSSGQQFTSEQFSDAWLQAQSHANRVVFIIGGAYGLAPEVLHRANLVWSLGTLTYPHQLVRLVLVEQLYRAQCIDKHLPYHHA